MTESDTTPKRGRGRPTAKVVEPVEIEQKVLIHFVEDGVSAFGYSWSAGQELEIDRSSEDFSRTVDRTGHSWLDKSEDEQIKQYGTVKWRKGPSDIPNPVLTYTPHPNETFDSIHKLVSSAGNTYLSLESKKKVAEAEKSRGRGIPVVSD